MVANFGEGATCFPPHDIIGERIEDKLPTGKDADRLIEIINKSSEIIERAKREYNIPTNATHVWPWGSGRAIELQPYPERYGLCGCVISAVSLIKGLGRLAGLETPEVEGATGFLDTNYKGKAESALKCLEREDIAIVHVEAPDEASHLGDVEAKIKAIENFDKFVVGTVFNGISAFDDVGMVVITDHYTPVSLKIHTSEPVPFAIMKDDRDDVKEFCEKECAKGELGRINAWDIMPYLVRES